MERFATERRIKIIEFSLQNYISPRPRLGGKIQLYFYMLLPRGCFHNGFSADQFRGSKAKVLKRILAMKLLNF